MAMRDALTLTKAVGIRGAIYAIAQIIVRIVCIATAFITAKMLPTAITAFRWKDVTNAFIVTKATIYLSHTIVLIALTRHSLLTAQLAIIASDAQVCATRITASLMSSCLKQNIRISGRNMILKNTLMY